MIKQQTSCPCGNASPHLRVIMAAMMILFGSISTARAQATPEQKYQFARESELVGEFPAMAEFLRQSAEAGFMPAQELLGIVLLVGDSLYGDDVPRNPCSAMTYFGRAAAQGSAIARTHYALLVRLSRANRLICR